MPSNLAIRIGEFFGEIYANLTAHDVIQKPFNAKDSLVKNHRIIKIRKFPHLSFVDSEPVDSEPDDRIEQIENSGLSRYQKIRNKHCLKTKITCTFNPEWF